MTDVESAKAILRRRGVVNIPIHFLAKAGLKPGSRVILISDGDLVVIKGIFNKPRGRSRIISRLKGVLHIFRSS